ncbi:hypothetical protein AAMO2058_000977000 [Amorphochlora amoebiformis]|eukprot:1335702-Amorphochlora_amoeboformis.AAC.2
MPGRGKKQGRGKAGGKFQKPTKKRRIEHSRRQESSAAPEDRPEDSKREAKIDDISQTTAHVAEEDDGLGPELRAMNPYDRIYFAASHIPHGKVATYGQIAKLAGLPGRARMVGRAMFMIPDADDTEVAWHRVINSKGTISRTPARCGNDDRQKELLEAEGIEFSKNGRIDFSKYRWMAGL